MGVSRAARLARWFEQRELDVFPPPAFNATDSSLVGARVPVDLALRAMARYHTAHDLRAAVEHVGTVRWLALSASAVVDAFGSRRLSRSRRLDLGRRLCIDLFDVALWSAACPGKASSPPLSAVPLVVEATIRRGWPASFTAVAHVVTCFVSRRKTRRTFRLVDSAVLGLAIGGAVAIRYWERERVRRLLAEVDHEIAAEREVAVLAGAADVMRTTVSIPDEGERGVPHDIIGNLRPFISIAEIDSDSTLARFLGNRKLAITEELRATEGPRYLTSVLNEWKLRVNRELPSLKQQVRFDIPDDRDALQLLTPPQTSELHRALDRIGPRGPVRAKVSGAGPIGGRMTVTIGSTPVVLAPTTELTLLDWADPSPAAAGLGMCYCLLCGTQVASHLRWRAVIPGACAFGALSLVAARESRRRGEASHYDMLRLSIVAAVIEALGSIPETRRSPIAPGGQARLPGIDAVVYPAVMLGFSQHSTTRRQRRLVSSALAAIAIGSQLVLPRPRQWGAWAFGGLFTAGTGFAAAHTYRNATERDSIRANQQLNIRMRQQLQQLQQEGRTAEWRMVEQACGEALAHLNTDDPEIVQLVTRRLEATRRAAVEATHDHGPAARSTLR